jgi:hypothetical protein
MPRKKEETQHDITKKKDPKPKNVQCVPSAIGDTQLIFVASKDIEKIVLGFSPKTAANLRSQKRGPPFYMNGGTPYYKVSELEDYFGRNRVETFNSD